MSINKGTLPPTSYLRDVIHECLLIYLAFRDLSLSLFICFDCRYQLKKCFLSTSKLQAWANIPIYFSLAFWYVPNEPWVFWIGVEGPGILTWLGVPGVWEGSWLGACQAPCVHKRRFEQTNNPLYEKAWKKTKNVLMETNAHSSEYSQQYATEVAYTLQNCRPTFVMYECTHFLRTQTFFPVSLMLALFFIVFLKLWLSFSKK